jgi:peroxiredoxin
MARVSKSVGSLALGAAGVALMPISPVAATVITGVAAWGAMMGTMFNVALTRWIFRAVVVMQTVTAYIMSGSVPFALAAFLAGLASDAPNMFTVPVLGTKWTIVARFVIAIPAVTLLVLAWPEGWSGLALLPLFLLLALGLFMNATMWGESNLKGPPKVKVKLGQPSPEVALPRRSGDGVFRLSEQRGQNVLLCFLRGDWCPVCQVLMRLYKKAAPSLAEHGVKLVMINPSSGEEARAFASEMGLDFEILEDANLEAAAALGIIADRKQEGRTYTLPVSFLVDRQGIVRFISGLDDPSILSADRIGEVLKSIEPGSKGAAPSAAGA